MRNGLDSHKGVVYVIPIRIANSDAMKLYPSRGTFLMEGKGTFINLLGLLFYGFRLGTQRPLMEKYYIKDTCHESKLQLIFFIYYILPKVSIKFYS